MQRLKPVDVGIAGGGFGGLLCLDELDYALRYRMMQNVSEETVTHRLAEGASAVHPTTRPVQSRDGRGRAGEHWGAISYRFFTRNIFAWPRFCAKNMAAQAGQPDANRRTPGDRLGGRKRPSRGAYCAILSRSRVTSIRVTGLCVAQIAATPLQSDKNLVTMRSWF